jgi:hypothetical protein
VIAHARQARANGAAVKLNTVVTRHNVREDMSALVLAVEPQRWKVFQVLRVEGQNEHAVDDLLITSSDFQEFVARHRALADVGIPMVAENNDAMSGPQDPLDARERLLDRHATRSVVQHERGVVRGSGSPQDPSRRASRRRARGNCGAEGVAATS